MLFQDYIRAGDVSKASKDIVITGQWFRVIFLSLFLATVFRIFFFIHDSLEKPTIFFTIS